MRNACSASAIGPVGDLRPRARVWRARHGRTWRAACSRSMRSKNAAAASPTSNSSCWRRRASAWRRRSASFAVSTIWMPARSAKPAHGFDELEPLDVLHELEGVAVLAAAEAMIEAALLVDVKARRLFFVERTEPDVASPAANELHGFADQLDEAGLLPDPIDRLLSDHSSCPATASVVERLILHPPPSHQPSGPFCDVSLTPKSAAR